MDQQQVIDLIKRAIQTQNRDKECEQYINQLTAENSPLYFINILHAATSQNDKQFLQIATLMAKNFLTSKLSTLQILRGTPWRTLTQEQRQSFINALNINMINGYQYVNQLLAILIIQSNFDEARAILKFLIQQIILETQTTHYIQEAIRVFKLVFKQKIDLYFPEVSQMIQYLLENTAKFQNKVILMDCIEILEQYSQVCREDISDELFNMIFQMLQQCVSSGNQKVIECIYQIFINGIDYINITNRMINDVYAIQHLLNYCIFSVQPLDHINQQINNNNNVVQSAYNNPCQDLIPLIIQQLQFIQAVVQSEKTKSIYNTEYIYNIIKLFIKPIIIYHSTYSIFDILQMGIKTLSKIYKNGYQNFKYQYKEYLKGEKISMCVFLQMAQCYVKEMDDKTLTELIEKNVSSNNSSTQIAICKIIKKTANIISHQNVSKIISKQINYYTQQNIENDEVYATKLSYFSRELCKIYEKGKLPSIIIKDLFNCFIMSNRQYFVNLSFAMIIRQYFNDEFLTLLSKGKNNMPTIHNYLRLTMEIFYPQLIEFNDRNNVHTISENELAYQVFIYSVIEANFFGFGDQIADQCNNQQFTMMYNLSNIPYFSNLTSLMQSNLQWLMQQNHFQYDNIIESILQAMPIVMQSDPKLINHQTIKITIAYLQNLQIQNIFNEVFNAAMFLVGHTVEYLDPQELQQMIDIVQKCLYQSVNSFPQIPATQFLINCMQSKLIEDVQFIHIFLQGLIASLNQFNLESEQDLTFLGICAKLLMTLQDHTQFYLDNGEKIAYTIIQSFEYRKKETNKSFYTALYINAFDLIMENYSNMKKREIIEFINNNVNLFMKIIKWVENSGFYFNNLESFKQQFGTVLQQNQYFKTKMRT